MILLALLALTVSNATYGQCSDTHVEIVVARYNEDVSWLNEYPFKCYRQIIYNKGPLPAQCGDSVRCVVETLPNVGRCDHTYLHHITSKYSSLANVTVFLSGSVQAVSWKKPIVDELMRLVNIKNDSVLLTISTPARLPEQFEYFDVTSYRSSDPSNRNLNRNASMQLCPERPFGNWYRKNFPKLPPTLPVIMWGSLFAMSREDIQQHSLDYYANLRDYLDTHQNPECGHYFERSWGAVFYPNSLKAMIPYEGDGYPFYRRIPYFGTNSQLSSGISWSSPTLVLVLAVIAAICI